MTITVQSNNYLVPVRTCDATYNLTVIHTVFVSINDFKSEVANVMNIAIETLHQGSISKRNFTYDAVGLININAL